VNSSGVGAGTNASTSTSTDTSSTSSTDSKSATTSTETPAANPNETGYKMPYPERAPKDGDEVAVIETGQGRIVLCFFNDKAPRHVKNFKDLANKKFYDGTRFHRVIPGFMIQGGDPNTKNSDRADDGTGGPGYNVKAEFNDLKHTRGILSMARTGDPDGAGSQFFIMHENSPSLDNQYSIFGQVVEGIEVVEKIVNLPKDANDNPTDDEASRVKSVKIVKWPVK
jgi:peptidyl-prolyl cis-trans isomerase B (cyclophilin B)